MITFSDRVMFQIWRSLYVIEFSYPFQRLQVTTTAVIASGFALIAALLG
jgi:hypothetical protein